MILSSPQFRNWESTPSKIITTVLTASNIRANLEFLSSKMESYAKAIGLMGNETINALNFGQTVLFTKDIC